MENTPALSGTFYVDCELLHNIYRICLKKAVRNARGPRHLLLFRTNSDSRANLTPGISFSNSDWRIQNTRARLITQVPPGMVPRCKDSLEMTISNFLTQHILPASQVLWLTSYKIQSLGQIQSRSNMSCQMIFW